MNKMKKAIKLIFIFLSILNINKNIQGTAYASGFAGGFSGVNAGNYFWGWGSPYVGFHPFSYYAPYFSYYPYYRNRILRCNYSCCKHYPYKNKYKSKRKHCNYKCNR